MIYFVGIGPGAPEFITMKALQTLQQAKTVFGNGETVPGGFLAGLNIQTPLVDTAGLSLEEQMDSLIPAYREKGGPLAWLCPGDPTAYGYIRPIVDILSREKIPYEIIPGVSHASAAAAAFGTEFTIPGSSQTLITTKLGGRTPMPHKETLALLAGHKASMAIYLHRSLGEELAQKLIEGGYSPSTPAALVSQVTQPEEVQVRGTVAELAEMAATPGLKDQVIALVGRFLGRDYEHDLFFYPDINEE